MLLSLVQFLESFVLTHGWWGLFIAAIAEEVIAPIPSAGIMAAGGLAFAQQPLTFFTLGQFFLVVVLPISAGVTLGSLLFYHLAKRYGRTIIDRYGKLLGISWSHIKRTEQFMQKGYADELLFVIARVIPIVPSAAVSLVAGFFEWPTKKYIVYTFGSTVIKTSILGMLAWRAGAAGKGLLQLEVSESMLFITLLMVCGSLLIIRKIFNHKKGRNGPQKNNI